MHQFSFTARLRAGEGLYGNQILLESVHARERLCAGFDQLMEPYQGFYSISLFDPVQCAIGSANCYIGTHQKGWMPDGHVTVCKNTTLLDPDAMHQLPSGSRNPFFGWPNLEVMIRRQQGVGGWQGFVADLIP